MSTLSTVTYHSYRIQAGSKALPLAGTHSSLGGDIRRHFPTSQGLWTGVLDFLPAPQGSWVNLPSQSHLDPASVLCSGTGRETGHRLQWLGSSWPLP